MGVGVDARSCRGGLACFGEIVWGLGTWNKTAAWQVSSEMAVACLVGQNGERGRTRDAQVPDNQTTARTSTSKRVTRYVTELAVLLGLVDTRAVKTRTPKIKATDGGARDVLEPLGRWS